VIVGRGGCASDQLVRMADLYLKSANGSSPQILLI
jgi:hypothetical protein